MLLSFAAALASFLPVALLVGGGLRSAAGLHLRALGWRADHLPREILLGIAGLALYLIAIFGWVRLLTPEAFAGFVHGVAAITVRQRVLFAVIGAAIAIFEESIARGFLQPNLMHRLGPWPGFAATALVFAAWHPPTFFLLGFLVRLSLGVIVGALRWRDRPLVAPAIAHALLWVVVGNS